MLKATTLETLNEFKVLLQRADDKLRGVHDENVLLKAKVQSLEDRLSNLSEKALHTVMEETVRRTIYESGAGSGKAPDTPEIPSDKS